MYRLLNDGDIELLKTEIENDPVHGKDPAFNAGIFVDPDGRSLVFEDSEGPVFFVNLRKEVRFTIQFRNGINKDRIRDCFKKYIPEFVAAHKRSGVAAMTYTTENKALAWFLRKFGFVEETVQRMVL